MYKLVTQDYTTHGGMEWEIGVTNRATAEGNEMCTDQVLHCYADPYLAVLFNPRHANIKNPRMLEIECSNIVATDGLKHACKEQTPIAEIELPQLTTRQKVLFAIKCSLFVYKTRDFVTWAENYISGADISVRAANAAAANAAADAAANAADAAYAAANAADAAAYAADAAAYAAANAANAADAAAYAAANAADAAAYAAYAAADAAGIFKGVITWLLEQS